MKAGRRCRMMRLWSSRGVKERPSTLGSVTLLPPLGRSVSCVSLPEVLIPRFVERERTTRRVVLTEEGGRYIESCLRILTLVEQANDDVRATLAAPAGWVRISCTAALGVLHVTGALLRFQDRYVGEVG